MEKEVKWTIAENVAKNAFGKLAIEEKYYPLFKERAISVLNDIVGSFEPDSEEIDSSLVLSGEYINNYVDQIKLGQSELWAETYADNMFRESKDDSVHESYYTVKNEQGKEQADKDLVNYAKSICDDPLFVDEYIENVHDRMPEAEEEAYKYVEIYKSLIAKGKSPIYARQFARFRSEWAEEYCDLYASKYEERINKGRDEKTSIRIAHEYVDLYEGYWPEDDNLMGVEAHKGYMEGFEYAIDNGIEPPEEFAKEYEEEYLYTLFPDEEEPPFKKQRKYGDIINKLLSNK